MGGSQSKTEVSQLSEQLNTVASQTVQSCEVAVSQEQTVKEVNTGIWFWSTVHLEQTTEIKQECFSDVQKQTDLQNKLISTISQTASTQGIALLDAFSAAGTTASANLTNIVRNNITMSNIQRSYNAIKQKQSVDFSNSGIMVFRQVDLTQGSKIFAAATLNELDKAGVFSTIESYLDQKTSTTLKNPLDFLTDLVGGITSGITTSMVTVVMIFFVIILSPFILIALISRIGGSSTAQPDYEPAPEQQPEQDQGQDQGQTQVEETRNNEEIPPVMPVSEIQQPAPPSPRQTARVNNTNTNNNNNNTNTTNTINTAIDTASTAVNLLSSLSKKRTPTA